jgi:hypothetical protein
LRYAPKKQKTNKQKNILARAVTKIQSFSSSNSPNFALARLPNPASSLLTHILSCKEMAQSHKLFYEHFVDKIYNK